MKIALKYGHDSDGNTQVVHVPLSKCQKDLNKLKKYEQALKLKSQLKEASEQVAILKKSNET